MSRFRKLTSRDGRELQIHGEHRVYSHTKITVFDVCYHHRLPIAL
jgi:hypothetical protein